ncbi:MAG TPA: ABC transporter permease [Jatrophihabitans sp.]|jgi:ABC-2 type transport system permease protein|uniref:ABC transporter permease n=1 Tax=Jatrophihabitans sp. TaxID=1932789 RepID=UPI002DF9F66E|nr:ABC transporter permease [Jatrophihabitans sp.]
MSAAMSRATARRVLTQLRHDPRTIALMVVVPSVLMVMLRYVFDSARVFSSVAPALLGFFPFLLMFLVTSITTLRERSSGTLERLLTTPMAKLDLLVGYAVAFSLVAIVQVAVAVAVSLALGLDLVGPLWALLLVALLDAILGVALGLFASAFARTEFQAVQFMPVVVLPQLLVCGLFAPRAAMTDVLRWFSDAMPLSYAVEALEQVAGRDTLGVNYVRGAIVLAACAAAALAGAAATLPRQTA